MAGCRFPKKPVTQIISYYWVWHDNITVQFCPFKITDQLFCNALKERGASRGTQGKKENFENCSMSVASFPFQLPKFVIYIPT